MPHKGESGGYKSSKGNPKPRGGNLWKRPKPPSTIILSECWEEVVPSPDEVREMIAEMVVGKK